MPAVSINAVEKASFHLASILCFRPLTSGASRVQRKDRRANVEFFPTQAMVFLGVVTGIAK